MAEGGPPPGPELNLLECPICLERLRRPKSLPCLHCFCQDCLGTYITKELSDKMASATSFPCPVCRGIATPVNPMETKETWAKQFPTNGVIKELIKLQEQSSEPLYCTPCQRKGRLTNPAKFWCKKMESDFCETCKVDHHDIIHAECDILDITTDDNNLLRPRSSVPRCGDHNENMVWYCEEHKILGCNFCVLKDHRCCKALTSTTEYLKMLKSGSKLTDMQEALKNGAEDMNTLVKDFDEQLQAMVENQEIALQSITDLRQRIDKRLDKLQKNCTDKLITVFKEEKRKTEDSLRQCERLKNSMLNTLKSAIRATERNEDPETIVLYQRGQAEVESCKALVTEMKESYRTVNIKHETESGTINDDAMGAIVTEKQPRIFPNSLGYITPLLGRRAREVQKFDVKTVTDERDCDVCGVVYLRYNQIVLSDRYNKKIKLYTDSGRYLDEMSITGDPWDMCLVDDNMVAVAVSGPGSVCVVQVKDSKLSLSSTISMPEDKGLFGITYTNGRFVVSTDSVLSTDQEEVYSVTQEGITELLHQYSCRCLCLSHDPASGDVLVSCHTDDIGKSVLSRLLAGRQNTVVIRKGIVDAGTGVTVDMENNIYLCGYASNNVVQMSRDGAQVNELLTSSDGLDGPFAIAVSGDMFVVAAEEKNYVRLFQLY